MWVGISDEMGLISLVVVDLYVDFVGAIFGIVSIKFYVWEFWVSVGFIVVGFMLDVEGWGKLSIVLVKWVD